MRRNEKHEHHEKEEKKDRFLCGNRELALTSRFR